MKRSVVFIERQKLEKVLKSGKQPLTEAELDELFREVDLNREGCINYESVIWFSR